MAISFLCPSIPRPQRLLRATVGGRSSPHVPNPDQTTGPERVSRFVYARKNPGRCQERSRPAGGICGCG